MSLYTETFRVAGMDFVRAGEASLRIKHILKNLGVNGDLTRRVAIACYEAEMNTVIYGGGGNVVLVLDEAGVLVLVEDQGPGIPDIGLAMREGWSTATEEIRAMGFGAGMGLPNILKNSDEFRIESAPGQGARLEIRFNHLWEEAP